MRVIVTGAASGIGRGTALTLARRAQANGAPATIIAVDMPGNAALDALVAELSALGAAVIPIGDDLSDAQAPERIATAATADGAGLDGLVSNAGINSPGALMTCEVDDWDRVFAVNVRASWLLAKAAAPALAKAGGSIVNVASMSGSQAHNHLGPYSPSKASLIMLTKVLAQELGPQGIRVNSVSPGMVRTGMTEKVYQNNAIADARDALVPLGRVAVPEDLADAIAFLLSSDARYVTGHDLVVDGGVTGNHLGRLPGLSAITRG
jgi:NAD(P)-dependent dehydrogenase (short-subunit alcohol dehydrogenase family)